MVPLGWMLFSGSDPDTFGGAAQSGSDAGYGEFLLLGFMFYFLLPFTNSSLKPLASRLLGLDAFSGYKTRLVTLYQLVDGCTA